MRTNFLRTVLLATMLGLAATPAFADVRIMASPGGEVGSFIETFQRVRASGERVVIDGPCLSACTLVLSYVPRDRVCTTSRAVLGFHGVRSLNQFGQLKAEPEASKVMLATYPASVRNWITRHGGLNSRLILLQGRELAAMVPSCR